MYAVFALEVTKGVLGVKFQGNGLDPGHVAFLIVELADLGTEVFAPHQVHAHEHRCPVVALGAARSGRDLQYGAHGILFAGEHVAKFEVFQFFPRGGVVLLHFLFGGAFLFVKIVDHFQVVRRRFDLVEVVHPAFFAAQVLHQPFGFLGVVPKRGILGFFFVGLDAGQFFVDVQIPAQCGGTGYDVFYLFGSYHI